MQGIAVQREESRRKKEKYQFRTAYFRCAGLARFEWDHNVYVCPTVVFFKVLFIYLFGECTLLVQA